MTSNPDELSAGARPVDELLALWKGGLPPDLPQFLRRLGPLEPVTLSELLRIDLRQRWNTPHRRLADQYLEMYPSVTVDPEAAIDLIYAEYLLQEGELGSVDVEAFIRRF